MKVLYGARMSRPDLCVATQRLASQITRWTADSDRKLRRLFAYIKHSTGAKLKGVLGTSDRRDLVLRGWPDADLCGDDSSSKSTSGFYLELAGKDGHTFPISWGSKRQGATSCHTCEAETVSLASCLRNELIPAQDLLSLLLSEDLKAELLEDNAACVIACRKGYSPAMKYLNRTQRIAIGFVHDAIFEPDLKTGTGGSIALVKADTKEHKGDMFTKALDPKDFVVAVSRIGLCQAE